MNTKKVEKTEVLNPDRVVSSKEMMEELTQIEPQRTYYTGYKYLDYMTQGFKEGDLIILSGLTGSGKCLGKGTPILMYDGSTKKVEQIKVGDRLMGDDSKPRNVLSVCIGKEKLYKVNPVKGDSYVVNESHILSVVRSYDNKVEDISVKDYLKLSKNQKKVRKGYRVSVEFKEKKLNIDPYLLGVWLGDGKSVYTSIYSPDKEIIDYLRDFANNNNLTFSKKTQKDNKSFALFLTSKGLKTDNWLLNELRNYNLINNKHIPKDFKCNNRENRLKILAGLLDTDGSLKNKCFEITTKFEQLNDDILFLARSLGFSAYSSIKTVKGKDYFRISICGDTQNIPTKIKRKQATKRKQIKNVLRTGFELEDMGEGNYYGFEIDGNKRFLLGDFTVTHNTEFAVSIAQRYIEKEVNPLFFSYEISATELLERFGTPVPTFYLPRISNSKSSEWIEKKIEEGVKKYNTKVIFIDHLHYLVDDNTTRNKNTSEMLAQICRDFKQMARRQRVIIFLLAHVRKYKTQRPSMMDIKDSSGIIQEADVVMLIHRKGKKRERSSINKILEETGIEAKDDDISNESILYIDKVRRRNGKLGNIEYIFENEIFKEK